MRSISLIRAITAAIAVTTLLGCGGGGGGGDASAGRVFAAATVVRGDGQAGEVGVELPNSLQVRLVDAGGAPVAGHLVTFHVTVGGGSVFSGAAASDPSGLVQERWTLGTTVGPQRVEVRTVMPATGVASVVATFNATAMAGPASRFEAGGGALVGQQAAALPGPLVVALVDRYGNPVPGRTVAFSPCGNCGSVSPAAATTDTAGRAAVEWTLGVPLGEQRVTASANGIADLVVLATATQAPPSAPSTVAVSANDNQALAQHHRLAQPLEAFVADALGNGVGNVTVTFALAGGPVLGTSQTRPGGYAEWQGYIHRAGAVQVVASVAGASTGATFSLAVAPSTHRFDGSYACSFRPLLPAPSIIVIELAITDGVVDGTQVGYPTNSIYGPLDETDGAFTGSFRAGLDTRYVVTGVFSLDAADVATAAGTFDSYTRGGFDFTSTWSCLRQ